MKPKVQNRQSLSQASEKPCFKKSRLSKATKALVAFLLQGVGAREKLAKENAEKEISPVATGEEAYAASTARAFEKARPKPLSN